MSRIAAPVGEVITPMRRGTAGSARLRSSANRPSAASRALSSLERALQRTEPGILQMFDQQLIVAARLVQADAAAGQHQLAFPGREARQRDCGLRNMAQRICASRSLSEKYQWPEDGRAKFDISPSTQTVADARSSSMPHLAVQRETE